MLLNEALFCCQAAVKNGAFLLIEAMSRLECRWVIRISLRHLSSCHNRHRRVHLRPDRLGQCCKPHRRCSIRCLVHPRSLSLNNPTWRLYKAFESSQSSVLLPIASSASEQSASADTCVSPFSFPCPSSSASSTQISPPSQSESISSPMPSGAPGKVVFPSSQSSPPLMVEPSQPPTSMIHSTYPSPSSSVSSDEREVPQALMIPSHSSGATWESRLVCIVAVCTGCRWLVDCRIPCLNQHRQIHRHRNLCTKSQPGNQCCISIVAISVVQGGVVPQTQARRHRI